MLRQEYKLIGQVLLGPLILLLAWLLMKLICVGLPCDTGVPMPILIFFLVGIIISLVGIPKGIYGFVKALKNKEKSGLEMKHLGIAIFIALIIFAILYAVLVTTPWPSTEIQIGSSNQEAASKIKTLLSFLGSPEKTGYVVFSKDASSLIAKNIAILSGTLTYNDICLDISPDLEELFERQEGIVIYTLDKDLQTKLLVVCDAANKIDFSINSSGVRNAFPNCTGGDNTQTICFVSVVPTFD